MRDETLLQYATERQREHLEAWWSEGNYTEAAKKLGCHRSRVGRNIDAVMKKAARQGYSPAHDMTRPVPDGFHLKGTSTYYDGEGNVRGQWVKSNIDRERQLELIHEAAAGLVEDLPKVKAAKAPTNVAEHLMACLPIGDHHMGLYAWHEEAGGDYDVEKAESLLCGATDHLLAAAPKCKRGAVLSMGDLGHYDSFEPVTPTNKNLLDSDGRFPKIVRALVRTMRYTISAALLRFEEVLVIFVPGNHDPALTVFLMEAFAAIFENEPRVKVVTSPSHFHYFHHGKCLVGLHHGHGPKLQDLPLIMATDQPELWGKTEHRYIWTGHVHHDQAKDIQGCKVESFRVLPPTDAWAHNKGYRSARDMKAIVLHSEYGEVARHTVNPRMLADV